MIDLYPLISAVNAQMFNPTELVILPTVIPTNEANVDIETKALTAET